MLAIMGLLAAPAVSEDRRYPAVLVRVVDGDTLRADLDLGAEVTLKGQALRVLGIDAPELREPGGRAAKEAVEKFLSGKKLKVELHGKEKYGRWLADVFADGENLAFWMLKNGYAKPYQIAHRRRR